jgi:excisionase family DNA binding protein
LSFSTRNAVAQLGLRYSTLRKLIDTGEIPIVRAGDRVMIYDGDLRTFIAQCRVVREAR